MYIDSELYSVAEDKLTLVRKMGNLKNPDTCRFSRDGKKLLIKNNNNIIQLYDIQSGKILFESKGTKKFGGSIYFLNDTQLVSSDYEGTIYSITISTNAFECSLNHSQLKQTDLFQVSSTKFILIGKTDSEKTEIYSVTYSHEKLIDKLLLSTTKNLQTGFLLHINNKLYFMSCLNEFVGYTYDLMHDVITEEKIISDFRSCDLQQCFEKEQSMLLTGFFDSNSSVPLIGMNTIKSSKYIILFFSNGLKILDGVTCHCVSTTVVSHGIMCATYTNEGEYIWLGTSQGVCVCHLKDLLQGHYAPKFI